MLLTGSCIGLSAAETEEAEENTAAAVTEETLEEGQRKSLIKVVSITGNELTYYELETENEDDSSDSETEEMTESETSHSASSPVESEKEEQKESSSFTQTETEPTEENEPSRQRGSGSTGEGFDPEQQRSGGMTGDGSQMQRGGSGSPWMSRDTKTVYLPVSVAVHTDTDEPTGALDQGSGKEVLKLFHRLNEMGNTIVMITHDTSVAQSAKRIVKIVDGELFYNSDE